MTSRRIKRRLAAILALDVVEYSRLMRSDEAATLAALMSVHKKILKPSVDEHGGRIVKLMGDGALSEFSSVVDAVECGLHIQKAMAELNGNAADDRAIRLRVGINLGDVIVEGADIFGDGVNIAARMEALAEPGEICVAGPVYEQVKGKLDAKFEDLGRKHVKNIPEPVHAYRVTPLTGRTQAAPSAAEPSDAPSIAVLALDNLSDDKEQQFLCDGVSEDVTTALSRFDWLFVAARNAAFRFKGEAADVKRIGRELGVRYVLEGSVQRFGERVRVNVQLVDTSRQGHSWADRIDAKIEDPFELQDELVGRIASTVAPELIQAEIARARRKPAESLAPWDHYLLALAGYYSMTRESVDDAIAHLTTAIQQDPGFANAYGLQGLCLAQAAGHGWRKSAKEAYLQANALAEKAVRMAPTSPEANHALAWVLMATGRAEEATTVASRSIELNPHYADAYSVLGHSLIMCGDLEAGMHACRMAARSSPRDARGSWLLDAMGHGYFFMGEYEKAIEVSRKCYHQDPSIYGALVTLACANARLGRMDEAKRHIDLLVQAIPRYTLSAVRKNPMFVAPELVENMIESLRLAGLPE